MRSETIFALSSGLPPSGIAVVRISGPQARAVLTALVGSLPEPRRASLRRFRDASGATLDDGLALWFPGPGTATGEDLAELHLHGGRAVVAAVLGALGANPGCRMAEAGEFTRRAFENGRIDLTEAEGLAALLAAETELQRRSALALAEGGMGRLVAAWETTLLRESARLEALLDFSDEGDVADDLPDAAPLLGLAEEMAALLASPPTERLRDGVKVVLGGPPNVGKSSLFNALIGRDAAIVTDIAGTTRDRIEAPVALDGVPLLFVDTAGLHEEAADVVEAMGMARSSEALDAADIVLWLGDASTAPAGAILVASKADLAPRAEGLPVSVRTGQGLAELRTALLDRAKSLLPQPGALALNARHRAIVADVADLVSEAASSNDALIRAEQLRVARSVLDRLTGRSGVESMLDALFGAFCIGK
jgi:tRNA modification GTPase